MSTCSSTGGGDAFRTDAAVEVAAVDCRAVDVTGVDEVVDSSSAGPAVSGGDDETSIISTEISLALSVVMFVSSSIGSGASNDVLSSSSDFKRFAGDCEREEGVLLKGFDARIAGLELVSEVFAAAADGAASGSSGTGVVVMSWSWSSWLSARE